MKPREQGGVVDARLNIYGTVNLKIVGVFCQCALHGDVNLNSALQTVAKVHQT